MVKSLVNAETEKSSTWSEMWELLCIEEAGREKGRWVNPDFSNLTRKEILSFREDGFGL